MKQYDAIIIGFGKGGKTLTAELAKRGWKVALIERSAMMYGGQMFHPPSTFIIFETIFIVNA